MDVSSLYKKLEIEVKSATLSAAVDGGSFYVKISLIGKDIFEHLPLQTKPSPARNGTVAWSQRLTVFVPEKFISDERSIISLTLVKARRLLPDLPVGEASASARKMFPVKDCLDYDCGGPWGTEYKEPEIQEREIFELRAAAERAPVTGSAGQFMAAAEVARLDYSICVWRRYYPYELNLRGRLEKKYTIINGDDKLGKLTIRWPPARNEKEANPAKGTKRLLCFYK